METIRFKDGRIKLVEIEGNIIIFIDVIDETIKDIDEECKLNWYHLIEIKELVGIGEVEICESEENFVNRLCKTIWKANEAYCKVRIDCICLDNLPRNRYEFSENEFDPECLKESD